MRPLLAASATSRRETGLAGLALAALAAFAFGSHVTGGGLYWDDWENAATTAYPPADAGFLGPIDLRTLAYRPLLALFLPLPHELFGPRPEYHLALALLLAVALSIAFYLVLRTVGLEPLHAGVLAALVLVFPWSDSTRLWSTAAVNSVALTLFLFGLALALRALKREPDDAKRLTIASLGLYAAAILTYEAVAAAAVASILLYVRVADRAAAMRRWRADLVVAGILVAFAAIATTRPKPSFGAQVDHAVTMASESLTLLGRAALPAGGVPAGVGAALVAAILAVAFLVRERTPADRPLRAQLGRWLRVAVAGGVTIGVGYAMFVPADGRYSPLSEGVFNRVNLIAALGFALLLYAAAMLVGTGVTAVSRGRLSPVPVALALVAAICVGWAGTLRADIDRWDLAAALQEDVLGALDRGLPHPPRGASIYTTGHRLEVGSGIPVFGAPWDLNGAVKVHYRDPTVNARPVPPGVGPGCRARGLSPRPTLDNLREPARYGRAYIVDVRTGVAAGVDSRSDCGAAIERLREKGRQVATTRWPDPPVLVP